MSTDDLHDKAAKKPRLEDDSQIQQVARPLPSVRLDDSEEAASVDIDDTK